MVKTLKYTRAHVHTHKHTCTHTHEHTTTTIPGADPGILKGGAPIMKS